MLLHTRGTLRSTFRRFLIAAVVFLALVSSATTVLPAAATTNSAGRAHKLIVVVKKTMGPAAEKKLAVLVLIRQKGGAPAGALAWPSKPLTIFQSDGRINHVTADINSCKGSCHASYRVSGSANHKLAVVPSCRPKGSGFVCSKVKIVKVY